MKTIDMLSIQPTFLCNYNCEYCYLGNLRKDKTILDLDIYQYSLHFYVITIVNIVILVI